MRADRIIHNPLRIKRPAWQEMGFFGFKKRVPARQVPGMLPVLDALYFYPPGRAKPALVEVLAQGACATRKAVLQPGPHVHYQWRTLVAPSTLQQWCQDGARFDLSRSGAMRVWLEDSIQAAESEADCLLHGARRLTLHESVYLDAYLCFVGRRWNDPDQRMAPGET